MRRCIPPLNAIVAFEATARLGSTVKAAEELSVTHGAVSKQIRELEHWLGAELFVRVKGRLVPTPAGKQYAEASSRAFGLLEYATRPLLSQDTASILRLSAPGVFVGRWLLPRLQRTNADLRRVEFDFRPKSNELRLGDCDLAISFNHGHWPDFDSTVLMPDICFPVCAPRLAQRIRSVDDLADYRLLEEDGDFFFWRRWGAGAGAAKHSFAVTSRFSDQELMLQAAISEYGVAMARGQIVNSDLEAGRLVRLFDIVLPIDSEYHLVLPKYGPLSHESRNFTRWIRNEANRASSVVRRMSPIYSSAILRKQSMAGEMIVVSGNP